MDTGVYLITNKVTDKVYIGMTQRSFVGRWLEHIELLKNGQHGCGALQHDFDMFGPSCFKFGVLERTIPKDALLCEKEWIHLAASCGMELYNRSGLGAVEVSGNVMERYRYYVEVQCDTKPDGHSKTGMHELTAGEAYEIKKKYTGTWGQQTKLAKEYGVSVVTIHHIVTGKTWSWV